MDFFSNVLKNTMNKVETLSKSATAAARSATNSPEQEVPGELPPETDGTIPADSTTGVKRSSSGDTSGPDDEKGDDEVQEGGDQEDGKNSFNSAEMSQKALESAKYLGNFLFNVANKAGQTVSATAKQIKTTVENVSIMQDFTKEQQEFIKEHGGKMDISEPPWIGCDDEEKVKEEILSLSQDKRNFVRSPPGDVEFSFDMNASYPVALALLREDPSLSAMRYAIVPKLVNEETFWRNYFYRVSLIKQDPNFTTAAGGGGGGAAGGGSWSSSSSEGPDDPNDQSEPIGDSEFVSDTFQASNVSVNDVRKDMYKLGIHQNDIEDELAKDLQEFEVVAGADAAKVDVDEIDRELENFDIK